MRKDRLPISEFLKNPIKNSDEYSNFYDWFCSSRSLSSRMLKLVPKLKFMVDQGIIDAEKSYVWFKNNYPLVGQLYDDIRISALNYENDYLGGLTPHSGHKLDEYKCVVWTLNGEFKERVFKNWSAFKKEVKENVKFKNELITLFKVK